MKQYKDFLILSKNNKTNIIILYCFQKIAKQYKFFDVSHRINKITPFFVAPKNK